MSKRPRVRHRNMFLIMAVSPVILLISFVLAILVYEKQNVREIYNLEEADMRSTYVLFDRVMLLNAYTKPEYDELENNIRENIACLENEHFLQEKNEELKEKYSFLVVEKGGEFIFFGNDEFRSDLEKRLPTCTSTFWSRESKYLVEGETAVLYKKIYYTENGIGGSVFIVTDVNAELPHIKLLTYSILGAICIVIIIISIAIVGYAYYYIIKPITNLQKAVAAISAGDYDHVIDTDAKDEFTGLYQKLEKMRQELKHSVVEQEKSDVLTKEVIGNISHDLKTPLTAIKGYAEGILDGVAATPERVEKYVRTIYTKASDMALLVDELAFFTKINQNDVPYNYIGVSVNRYFIDCISELSLDLELKNINLIFQTKISDDVIIYIDVEKIKRVVNNIIGNAAKYIKHQQGIILVKVEDEDNAVIIRMEDNGAGISGEELPYIFDRFYRTDSSRNSTTGGSGLGLAITKKIIQDHGGEIWAESREGKGTAIIFKIEKTKRGKELKEDVL